MQQGGRKKKEKAAINKDQYQKGKKVPPLDTADLNNNAASNTNRTGGRSGKGSTHRSQQYDKSSGRTNLRESVQLQGDAENRNGEQNDLPVQEGDE